MKPPRQDDERQALLEDYATIARRRGPRSLEATALRTRSEDLRELLAYLASSGRLDYDSLVAGLDQGGLKLDPLWTASLGRTVALQNRRPEDRRLGLRLLDLAIQSGVPKHQDDIYTRLLVELSLEAGEFERAKKLLKKNPQLAELDSGYLAADLRNPHVENPLAKADEWPELFAAPFTSASIEAPFTDATDPCPFNTLHTAPVATYADGPLVTVILTTYKPQRSDVLLSARSILAQSHSNLELLVVDDASPGDYETTLLELERLDPRVRIIRVPTNGGTYLARNIGIKEASGEYVTCQDADDWSHPRRIELQLRPLEADPGLPATRSRCIAVQENMMSSRPGYRPRRPNASSLMFRRTDAIAIGGFLRSRRAADSEFHYRLEARSGREAKTLIQPLAIIRILSASLSRSDFSAGWSHPARRAFVDSYKFWHATSGPQQLVSDSQVGTIIPDRFSVSPVEKRSYDVVFAGDWRSFGGPQRSMIEEIKAALRKGLTVGIMHMEAARFMSTNGEQLCDPIQKMLNERHISRLFSDDAHSVNLLVLRYPPILQFLEPESCTLQVRRLAILANQAPAERDGSDRRYIVGDCDSNAERFFGLQPTWIPQGPVVRAAIVDHLPGSRLAEYDMPGILDVDEWRTERVAFRSDRPVVGRHSRDNKMKWPASAAALQAAYPVDGRFDVRVMGGIKSVLSVIKEKHTPAGWISFDKDELEVRTFLNSLDFFVNFTHPEANEAFGRAILEALATGCVTILPASFEATFGEAAIYSTPREVAKVVAHLFAHPDEYRRQSNRAIDYVQREFGYESYGARLDALLADGTPDRQLRLGHPAEASTPAG